MEFLWALVGYLVVLIFSPSYLWQVVLGNMVSAVKNYTWHDLKGLKDFNYPVIYQSLKLSLFSYKTFNLQRIKSKLHYIFFK